MCNVYTMYSFEPFDNNHQPVVDPFSMCWDNQLGQVTKYTEQQSMKIRFHAMSFSMIPADSEIRPKKPDEMSESKGHPHQHAEHAMNTKPGIAIPSLILFFSSLSIIFDR